MSKVKVGDVRQHDFQSDVWETSYRVVRHVKGNEWEVEQLPASEEVLGRVLDFWAGEEARGAMTLPVWDKTWAECAEGEHPQRVRWMTYEEMLERDLQHLEEWAGCRSVVKFVSRDEWAKHF